jgi:glycosyltransferase involved in cell wall biosynthesis
MSFSIIIPVYNDIEGLNITLDSLRDVGVFEDERFEVIVVQDGEGDAISTHPVVTIINPTNVGSYVSRNNGAKVAKGDYLVFLDADVIVTPAWYESVIKNNYDYVCGQVKMPDSPKKIIEKYQSIFFFRTEFYYISRSYGVTANLIVKRETFVDVGMFLPVRSGGDMEFGARIFQYEYSCHYNRKLTVIHPYKKNIREIFKKFKRIGIGHFEVSSRNVLVRRLYNKQRAIRFFYPFLPFKVDEFNHFEDTKRTKLLIFFFACFASYVMKISYSYTYFINSFKADSCRKTRIKECI